MNQNMPITLQEIVVDGLTRLMALRLRGTPAAENIQQTASVWIAAMTSRPIVWDAELDRKRLAQAFVDLAATMTHWPAPSDLLQALQPREQLLTLPKPTERNMSPQTRQLVDNLLKKLRGAPAR